MLRLNLWVSLFVIFLNFEKVLCDGDCVRMLISGCSNPGFFADLRYRPPFSKNTDYLSLLTGTAVYSSWNIPSNQYAIGTNPGLEVAGPSAGDDMFVYRTIFPNTPQQLVPDFSVGYTAYFYPPETGNYTFSTGDIATGNAAAIFVMDSPDYFCCDSHEVDYMAGMKAINIPDDPNYQNSTATATTYLIKGNIYLIKIAYLNIAGGASFTPTMTPPSGETLTDFDGFVFMRTNNPRCNGTSDEVKTDFELYDGPTVSAASAPSIQSYTEAAIYAEQVLQDIQHLSYIYRELTYTVYYPSSYFNPVLSTSISSSASPPISSSASSPISSSASSPISSSASSLISSSASSPISSSASSSLYTETSLQSSKIIRTSRILTSNCSSVSEIQVSCTSSFSTSTDATITRSSSSNHIESVEVNFTNQTMSESTSSDEIPSIIVKKTASSTSEQQYLSLQPANHSYWNSSITGHEPTKIISPTVVLTDVSLPTSQSAKWETNSVKKSKETSAKTSSGTDNRRRLSTSIYISECSITKTIITECSDESGSSAPSDQSKTKSVVAEITLSVENPNYISTTHQRSGTLNTHKTGEDGLNEIRSQIYNNTYVENSSANPSQSSLKYSKDNNNTISRQSILESQNIAPRNSLKILLSIVELTISLLFI